MNTPTSKAKRALRARMTEARAGLGAARAEASVAACARFVETFAERLRAMPPPAVSAFWPMGDEIDCRPLLEMLDGMGCVCALPVVSGKGEPLLFRRWRPGNRLVAASFGLEEPSSDAPAVVPEIVIAPCLAVAMDGARLGYGGGYYDRSLRRLRQGGPTLAVALAFDAQIVDAVPTGVTDETVDWIVTEARAICCR